ncbi:MAG: acetyl-CoA carboxylase biotin carboxylase subunit [Thermomicrobiales bacterium]|nr:acetyl-CoA carboxylase biotin carboxylase subunit [Thermomicrobiales bacterium]
MTASQSPFQTVLIANRGEIAVRVARTLREMGIRSVAVYSDADAGAPHVRAADAAVNIGPAPAAQSYLNQERLLEAARETGAAAIHPGYGFLSENAIFARRCAEAGIAFIGPSPEAIEAMGSKIAARQAAKAAGVPIVPGTEVSLDDAEAITAVAANLGYPVAIKAAAGGGGYGMRVANSPEEIQATLDGVRRDAERAFGDATVYVEKFFSPAPRHIEIQILGDRHGRVVHLGERECSLQRRFQKIVEETPSVAVSPELRERMGAAAVALATQMGYTSAGTIECLLDRDGSFYFLEMNTRLQVEHPVTEMVTGVDLVREMVRIAAGEPMAIPAGGIAPRGHAIEARVYAEDPAKNFMPSPGEITRLELPAGEGIRVDAGVETGSKITFYYDPMIAKVIAWGETRPDAVARLRQALDGFVVEGIKTNLPFLRRIAASDDFAGGAFHTRYVDEHLARIMAE